jgi:hypothetical protein
MDAGRGRVRRRPGWGGAELADDRDGDGAWRSSPADGMGMGMVWVELASGRDGCGARQSSPAAGMGAGQGKTLHLGDVLLRHHVTFLCVREGTTDVGYP